LKNRKAYVLEKSFSLQQYPHEASLTWESTVLKIYALPIPKFYISNKSTIFQNQIKLSCWFFRFPSYCVRNPSLDTSIYIGQAQCSVFCRIKAPHYFSVNDWCIIRQINFIYGHNQGNVILKKYDLKIKWKVNQLHHCVTGTNGHGWINFLWISRNSGHIKRINSVLAIKVWLFFKTWQTSKITFCMMEGW
jgi:hypothetical protein